jgi:NAD+ kinase
MIKTISINFRPDDEESLSIVKNICRISNDRQIRAMLPDYHILESSGLKKYIAGRNDYLNKPDLVVSIGGDGTFMRSARMFINSKSPIFGINRGRLGFMTEFNPDEYERHLENIILGDFTTSEKTVMEVVHNLKKGNTSSYFINDGVMSKGAFSRAIVTELFIDDVFFNRFSGDGLIISTATGSTAYSLSAGGPIISPAANGVCIINPVCPHSLATRPVVIPSSSIIRARILSDVKNLLLTIDGQEAIEFSCGDEILFRESDKKMKLIVHPEKDFYHILREKLNWGRDY